MGSNPPVSWVCSFLFYIISVLLHRSPAKVQNFLFSLKKWMLGSNKSIGEKILFGSGNAVKIMADGLVDFIIWLKWLIVIFRFLWY